MFPLSLSHTHYPLLKCVKCHTTVSDGFLRHFMNKRTTATCQTQIYLRSSPTCSISHNIRVSSMAQRPKGHSCLSSRLLFSRTICHKWDNMLGVTDPCEMSNIAPKAKNEPWCMCPGEPWQGTACCPKPASPEESGWSPWLGSHGSAFKTEMTSAGREFFYSNNSNSNFFFFLQLLHRKNWDMQWGLTVKPSIL